MVRHHLKRHRYKIVVGIPVTLLLASTLSLIRTPEQVYIVPEDGRFVAVEEPVVLHVVAEADEPINVIGATISYPVDALEVISVSREHSIIDLWTEEPTIEDGRVRFSGGTLREGGFVGKAVILSITVRPKVAGNAQLLFEESKMLAHDGTGMNVKYSTTAITLIARPSDHPSPDVNGDKVVNVVDFGIVSSRLFLSYNKEYDLNQDGEITMADIGIIIANMTVEDDQSSLALLWLLR